VPVLVVLRNHEDDVRVISTFETPDIVGLLHAILDAFDNPSTKPKTLQ
jgi:hypothetical protein